jgi:hypothetical protein
MVGLFFEINKVNRPVEACIFCASSLVMLLFAAHRVQRPTGIVAAIRTFENITIISH